MSTRWILIGAVALLSSGVAAQPQGEDIVVGKRHVMTSKVLGEERGLQVFLPGSYASGDERYPILILLDTRSHFHHGSGVVDFLAKNGCAPEMIMIGVQNTRRTRDLTPDAEDGRGGGADAFLKFLTDELTPWADQHYRTRPVRLLVGHSFGGLFAVHALTTKPDFFQGIVAVSPSMQWADQASVKRFETWLEGSPKANTSIYMTVGNEGRGLLGGR